MPLRSYLSRLLALVLAVTIGLMGFSSASASASGLTGNYSQDTLKVIETLTTTIDLPADAPNQKELQATAREQINDYISRYRRNSKSGGLRSFTTMQTALNSLAGYYTAYGARPLPDKLKKRLQLELKQAKIAAERGV